MRLFLALFPPEELAREVERRCRPLRRELPPARWTAAPRLHLTLHFFGERSRPQAETVTRGLRSACRGLGPLELQLGRLESFSPRRPRVLWLGVGSEPEDDLEALYDRVLAALRSTREEGPDKPFRAHLTVARCRARWSVREVAMAREALAPLERRTWTASRLDLVASELRPEGPRYTVVESVTL